MTKSIISTIPIESIINRALKTFSLSFNKTFLSIRNDMVKIIKLVGRLKINKIKVK